MDQFEKMLKDYAMLKKHSEKYISNCSENLKEYTK